MSQASMIGGGSQSAGWLIWLLPVTLAVSFISMYLLLSQAPQARTANPGLSEINIHAETLGELSRELEALVRMELAQRVQEQLSDPQVVVKSLSDVVAEELRALIREADGHAQPDASAGIPVALQGAASEHIEAQLHAAIEAGVWRAEDTRAVLPHLGVISPEDRADLLRRFHEALAQGRLDLDGPMPPL